MLTMVRISLLIGLIVIGNGMCQVWSEPESSIEEEDMMASAATLFGPKTFGLHHSNLGNFGPFGYGGFGGMRLGRIGPLRYGHIGGIRADSFLGAGNPNEDGGESPGGPGTPSGDRQYQDIVGSPMEQSWQGIDVQENIVGMAQNSQGTDGQANFVGMPQNYQGIDGQANFVGMPQNYQGIDDQNNFVGMEQNYQGIDGQANFVGMPQNYQGIDGQQNFVGMEPNWQGFGDQNILRMGPNEQEAYQLELQPQVPDNSRAFLNDGLFGVKANKFDKFEKIPPKPAPPPKFPKHPPTFTPPPLPPLPRPPTPPSTYDYYGGYGSNSHGISHGSSHGSSQGNHGSGYGGIYRYGGGHHSHHGHHGGHHGHGGHRGGGFNKFGHGGGSLFGGGHRGSLFRNDVNELEVPQGYESYDQLQQFDQINYAMPPATTTPYPYQRNIIPLEQLPQSRQSARSSVDDLLTGLGDSGFDFEFRGLIEDVFLAPYLGLLDPNDLDDETLLLL